MLKLHIALLGVLLGGAPLAAAPYLVKDLNRGPADPGTVLLYDSAAVGSVLYFPGFDPAHGTELWRSDGTAAGTYRVTDVCPGRCDSTPASVSAVGGKVYFQADDGVFGVELWVSDGIPGHERRVRDLCPGPCGSDPQQMTAVGDQILFFVQLGERTQLWRTDGTRAGTARVATLCIQPQECVGFDSLRSVGTRAFFEVYGAATIELWETDGTAAGTFPLTDLVSDLKPSNSGPIPASGFIYSWNQDGLWRSDGTAAGTFEVKALSDLLPAGSASDRTDYFHAVAGGLLYTVLGSGDLVRSDGTAAGTFLLHKFTNGSAVSALIPLADRVLLALDDTPGPPASSLWESQGTPESTVQIADFRQTGVIDLLSPLGSRALFRLEHADNTADLWTTDGTAAGTALVAAGIADTQGTEVFQAAGGQAFFLQPSAASAGALALQATDGATVHPVHDFGAGPGSSGPLDQTEFAGGLLFSARTSPQAAPLFRTDGTAAGTHQISADAEYGEGFTTVGEKVFFSAGSANPPLPGNPLQDGLWRTDGTPAGTVRLADLLDFRAPKRLGQELLFTGAASVIFAQSDLELWRSDGTAKGTGRVKQINPYDVDTGFHHICVGASSNPGPGVVVGNRVLFAADDGVHGRELWASDGTAKGTRLVADINPLRSPELPLMCEDEGPDGRTDSGLASNPDGFARLGAAENAAVVLFAADDGTTGRELWRTDGTAKGTRRVADLLPGPLGSGPHDLTRLGNLIYFFASPTGTGDALYRTDGTAKGTVLVSDLQVNGTPTWAKSLTVSGGRLFFIAYDELLGAELWTSTGKAGDSAATHIVADLNPGPASAAPQFLTDVSGVLLFAADDGVHGLELWRTDGTGTGTIRLYDINPGPSSSSPGPFTIAGDRVYFGADDGVHGRELWAILLTDILTPTGAPGAARE